MSASNENPEQRWLLLDSAGMYFRAFYALPRSVRGAEGQSANAIRGFFDALSRFIAHVQPTHVVACWDDDWRPQWRVDLVPTYKTHRVAESGAEEEPEELTPQVPAIAEALSLVGLARVGVPTFEADDVLGSYVTHVRERGARSVVVSGDRDLFQLVSDANRTQVLYTAGKGGPVLLDDQAVMERTGLNDPSRYADFATLRGDSSDGLPGARGIGEKTAALLINHFGGLDQLLAAALNGAQPGLTARQASTLVEQSTALKAARAVTAVRHDLRVPLDGCEVPSADTVAQVAADHHDFIAHWSLERSIERLIAALGEAEQGRAHR